MKTYIELLRKEWGFRPWWMNLIWFFCIYMTFIYMPFDIFWKDVEIDDEVWCGITLHGWYAKATEPLHWFIYGAGAFGFWKMKAWMWPWAGVYSAQVSIAFCVYAILNGGGIIAGIISGSIFLIPTVLLLRARSLFFS